MNDTPIAAPTERRRAWWGRAHDALMPDYNRKATIYWLAISATGALVLGLVLHALLPHSMADWLQIAGGVAIAMLAASMPVRVPGSQNSFAAAEIFIFLLLLVHGPEAATLAAAAEALIGSWRTSRRWTSRIISPATACVAMYLAGSALESAIARADPAHAGNAGLLLVGTVLCGVVYFVLNTLLITTVVHLKRSQWPSIRESFSHFGWLGISYTASASIACLLYLTYRQSGAGVLLAAAPMIALMLATLHYYFRQKEADEATRQSRVDAAARETGLAARHMQELAVSERRFHSAFTHASIGMALVSFDAEVLQVNSALRTLLGFGPKHSFDGVPFRGLIEARDVTLFDAELDRLRSQQTPSFAIDLRMAHQQPVDVWAAVHASFFSEPGAAAPSLILQVQDITARRAAEAGLHHIAFHDSLTGLPNRRRFQLDLLEALSHGRSDPNRHFALMFLDFDRFKLINDSLGHAVGDEFLIEVAGRLRQHARPSDVVARLGGDEFAFLIEDVDSKRCAVDLAERLLAALRQPFRLAGTDFATSASIGITFSGMGYATPEDMLRDADTAMYKAKTRGKDRYELFDMVLHTEVAHRLRLEGDLRRALAEGAMSAAYQPMFDLGADTVIGFEALARWNHPQLGALNPMTFIDIAEDAGLIMSITDFMLRMACRQIASWQQRDARFAKLRVHVNVSGPDVSHPGFVSRVVGALREASVDPSCLTLELTENILMERLQAALPTLAELRRLGVGLSVDDFGTGYSSLRHLSTLPVTSLKVDRAFVADLQDGSEEAAAVVGAIVSLGRSLGKAVIAEGIETAEQMRHLRQLGCSAGQGFYLCRPGAADFIDDLLDNLLVGAYPLRRA